MDNFFALIFCLLGIPFGLGLLIGWIAWGRGQSSRQPSTTPPRAARAEHEAWLATQIDRQPLASVLTSDQRDQLRYIYAPTGVVSPAPPAPAPESEATAPAEATDSPTVPAEDRPLYDLSPVLASSAPAEELPASPLAPEPPIAPRPVRDPLDPAVLMLYAGALLVVAAGIVYAAYNWADLAAWQKLGMLAAATIAFAATGWVLLGNRRVRQAAETFIAISALLIPANAIAAWTVVQDREASIAILVLVGSAVTSLAYAAFSIRPGGILYSYGSTILAWLALGSIPAAVGLHWGWGAPLVILAVGAVKAYPGVMPAPLTHLRPPLLITGIFALAIAIVVGIAAAAQITTWIAPITLAATTITLAVHASRERTPTWGVLTSLAGTATAASIVIVIDPASAWGWTIPPLVVAAALLALGERGPQWLRIEPVRRVLHVEAIVACLLAVAGADNHDWLRVAVLATSVVITVLIAWLRDSRWWLLATGAMTGLLWTGIAAALDTGWSTANILVYAAALVVILAASAWWLDRWSERTARPLWGEPLWLSSAGASTVIYAVAFTPREIKPGETSWLLVGGISVVLALTALAAAWSIRQPVVRLLAGIFGVLAAVCTSLAPDIDVADRLPLAMVLLLVLTIGAVLLGRESAAASPLRVLAPRTGTDRQLEVPVLLFTAVIVLLGMMALALRYLATATERDWPGMPDARWTWISYTGIFALVALLAAWASLRNTPATSRLPTRARKAAAWVLPIVAVAFSGLALMLVVRMQTTAALAGVLALSVLAWAVLGAAVAASRSRERITTLVPWRWSALGLGVLAVAYPLLVIGRGDAADFRSLMVIALLSLAGLVGTEAWLQRNRLLATGASGIAMFALLLQISQRDPDSILAYSLPLGIYLLALGTVNRKVPSLRDILLGAGSGVLLAPVFLLAQESGSLGYLALAGGLALALFLAGIALRLRVLIAAGIIGLSLIVLRVLVDAVIALESWVSLLVVGLLLLGGGTASLIWKETLRARLERLQRGWHDMG